MILAPALELRARWRFDADNPCGSVGGEAGQWYGPIFL
jgi:hypothetical protein